MFHEISRLNKPPRLVGSLLFWEARDQTSPGRPGLLRPMGHFCAELLHSPAMPYPPTRAAVFCSGQWAVGSGTMGRGEPQTNLGQS